MVVLALCQPFGVTQDKPYVPQGKGWGYFLFITNGDKSFFVRRVYFEQLFIMA